MQWLDLAGCTGLGLRSTQQTQTLGTTVTRAAPLGRDWKDATGMDTHSNISLCKEHALRPAALGGGA